jgi:hypothetical protein
MCCHVVWFLIFDHVGGKNCCRHVQTDLCQVEQGRDSPCDQMVCGKLCCFGLPHCLWTEDQRQTFIDYHPSCLSFWTLALGGMGYYLFWMLPAFVTTLVLKKEVDWAPRWLFWCLSTIIMAITTLVTLLWQCLVCECRIPCYRLTVASQWFYAFIMFLDYLLVMGFGAMIEVILQRMDCWVCVSDQAWCLPFKLVIMTTVAVVIRLVWTRPFFPLVSVVVDFLWFLTPVLIYIAFG